MFLDKLWLRIKGELIVLREDVSAGADIREKASILLDKLEQRLNLPDVDDRSVQERSGRQADQQSAEPEIPAGKSLDDIHRQWRELEKLKEDSKGGDDESEPPPPNPRTLG